MSDTDRTLPPRPDLRHLRDEAKRRRRSGEFATLARAQLTIAREHGFASWPLLKFHVEALTLDAAQRAQALVRSACSFDLRRARALLAADPAIGRHDIASACVAGEPRVIARALERDGAAASRRCGPLGWEPILYACFSRLGRGERDRATGIREVVALLLGAGADPNASFDQRGWLQVPLYGAAGIANDAELTRILIEAGADPNDAGETRSVGEALYHACEFADPACARLLIEAGTDRAVVDYCLGRVLNFPHHEMVAMFCAQGARASAGNLHQALWRRRPPATVAVLLDAGAPLEERDQSGLTPLQIATRWGSELETVELLERRGADPASVTDADRQVAAMLASDAPPPRSADTAALDEMLETAIEGGHLDAVRALLRAGAAPDGRPQDEHTPLGQAAWRGHAEIVAELIRHGASLVWEDGSGIGAALHGSRHCHDPEGGPTMQTFDEVPKERYAKVVTVLLAAGATIPARLGEDGPRTSTILAEIGLDPPD